MSDRKVRDSLDQLIKALCLDYERRDRLIREGLCSRRVDNELRYLNFKIQDAVSEVVGERLCEPFITEIGSSVGFASSSVEILSESTYKTYKKEAKRNVAKRLYLM